MKAYNDQVRELRNSENLTPENLNKLYKVFDTEYNYMYAIAELSHFPGLPRTYSHEPKTLNDLIEISKFYEEDFKKKDKYTEEMKETIKGRMESIGELMQRRNILLCVRLKS